MTEEVFEIPDEDLLHSIAAGDREAFLMLYRRYQNLVHAFAFQLSGDESVADDVTQDTFLAVTRGAQRYDPARAKLSTYLYGTARNLTRRRLRRERIFVALTGWGIDRWEARESSIEQSMVDAAGRQAVVDRVRRAVRSLPIRYREVVALCDLQGRDYAEAAAIVGCAVGTIRSRLHRGRELLRQKLQDGKERERQ